MTGGPAGERLAFHGAAPTQGRRHPKPTCTMADSPKQQQENAEALRDTRRALDPEMAELADNDHGIDALEQPAPPKPYPIHPGPDDVQAGDHGPRIGHE